MVNKLLSALVCCHTLLAPTSSVVFSLTFLCQILLRLSRLCVQDGLTGRKSRKQQQRLLRNMGAHAVVLELLQIPYEKVSRVSLKDVLFGYQIGQTVTSVHFPHQGEDLRMQDIMKLAHQFLQNFCAGNQQNQALLHKHVNLFLNPGVSRPAKQRSSHMNVNMSVNLKNG